MPCDWPAWTNDIACPWCGNTLLPLGRMAPPEGGCPGCHRSVGWQFPDPMPLAVALVAVVAAADEAMSRRSSVPATIAGTPVAA